MEVRRKPKKTDAFYIGPRATCRVRSGAGLSRVGDGCQSRGSPHTLGPERPRHFPLWDFSAEIAVRFPEVNGSLRSVCFILNDY